MNTELDYKTEIFSKIAENDNIIKILTAKSEKSFNELQNHLDNTPLTRSQLSEIREALGNAKAEIEQVKADNKIIRDAADAYLATK